MQYVLESDSSTGVAGMCLSPNNTCAAVIFNRDGAMEVQILDLNPEAETPDIALNAKRCVIADLWSCFGTVSLAMLIWFGDIPAQCKHQALMHQAYATHVL